MRRQRRRTASRAPRHHAVVRTLAAHEHRSAALLLGLLVFAYLWPALVQGHVLEPTALLYLQAPFHAVAPPGVQQWINGDLGDAPYAYYPWNALARQLVHAGTFPAWNPHAFAGTPLWANSQIAWLSPFSVPLWILPLNYALGVAAALKLWVAGFGTYLLARELRLGFWPALLAGVAFALCSFNVVWLSYGVFASVAALLPWALWLTERIVRRGRAADGLWLAGVLAVALTGGHPGTQVHLLAATAVYALARAAVVTDVPGRERARRLSLVAGGTAVALLATAVVLLPAERAADGTVGAAARAHGAPGFAGSHMPAGVLRTVLFPDWWGRPSESVSAGPSGSVSIPYRERTFYAGAATAVLALVALLTRGGWRRKAPFALLGCLSAAIALRLPGLYDAVIHLPGFDRIQNSRVYVVLLLALAVLAGFGLQAVLDARGRLKRAWLAFAAALSAAVVAVAAIGPPSGAWTLALEHALRRTHTRDAAVLSLASVMWWLLSTAALTALVLLLRARPRWGAWTGAAIALLVVLDLLHVAHGFQPMGPASRVVPPRTQAVAFLQRHSDAGRIVGIAAMDADWPTLYGLRDVRGWDQPFPTFRFLRLWRTMDATADPFSLATLTERSAQVLGVLGARWLLLPPGSDPGGLRGLRRVYDGRDATIVENGLAAPHAFVASRVRIVDGAAAEMTAIAEPDFDPRHEATVRAAEAGPDVAALAADGGAAGSARIVDEANASVKLRARLTRPGLVVLDDQWAPGWSVAIDGRPARAAQANGVLRAVAAPAGEHEIVWRYRVPGLRLGAALSALGLALAAAWAAALVLRARRT